ncbi:hypothetical protein MVLG_00729 [Microbotryum lychnidis-dioicae p1A1 Lamole]|uniref:Uncharacterized protein n=1 Tax=Microbotryum lychnidis-dioicae (strain p1A1 Lamole / MvSl-1064) TaxID=683840 RepID=U5GZY5_USTV1|nr:hypothetical protein MVLG_00729 [Microbotryum lychnidis-dioicae p1A1 Lamole]|eukprot:KDE09007.1 hypothetical protein MVLG_00729 [Microbotryum lychnidis-dioicae p1A1 Lamole]
MASNPHPNSHPHPQHHGNNIYADPHNVDHARNIVVGSSYTMHYPIGPPLDIMHAYAPMPMPMQMPMNHMPMQPSHRPSVPMMPLQPITNTASSSFIWPASPPKAAAPNTPAAAPWPQNVLPPPPSAAPNPKLAAAATTTTKAARGGAAAKRKSIIKDEAAAAQSAALLLAPDYTANPAGPASSSDTDFKCSYCDKIYKGKHARSIWRRHLQDKHGIPLASQPRRTRWDNDANRPKSEEERRARTLDSKRRWARKNRGTDGRSAGGDTPGRGGSASFDGRDEGEWEDDQFGDEDGSSAGGRSRSNSASTWQESKTALARSGSVPTLGGAGRLQDEKPDRSSLRASQSTSAVPHASEIDPRHPQQHRGSYAHGPPAHLVQPRGSHLPHSPSSYYQAPLAAAVPIGGALSAPLFPQANEAEFYRSENPTSMMQRLGASIPRPASASSLPPPYAPAQSTSSASLAYYASRASPGRGSRTTLRRDPKSPIRTGSNTEDAAGVLLALKMASPSTSSILQSPVSATRSRRFDDDSDDDEEEDEEAGDLSLEANEPFSAFTAKQASRRTGGSRLVASGRGAAFASPTRDPPSSPEGSDSSIDNWSRNEGEASTSTMVDPTSSKRAGKKRSAEDSPPPYGSAQALVGLSASARKIRPIAGIAPNGNGQVAGRPLGPNSSYHQYTSLTATPTPAMRVTMESSPAMVYGRDLLEGGSIGRGPRHDHHHDDDDGDLEEDEPSRGGRVHDGSPSRAMRSHRNGNGPIEDASSSAPRAHHHHPYSHGYPSSASSARHYPQALHHHHPVGLTSDLGHFNLSSSSDPSHPSSSSSSMPPHPSSSSASFPHSTPGGVSTDYYRLRGSSPPSRSNGGSGYLFSSPAHPGISKQLGLHAQPGPGVLFSGETPGRNAAVDVLESRSKGMRLVEEGGSRAVLKLED